MAHGRVLVIAYFFPPIAGSGTYRTLKFVKYLPQFGWQPFVVCGDKARPFDYGYDESLLAEVPPEARILRMPFISPYGVRARLQRLFHVRSATDDPDSPEPERRGQISDTGKGKKVAREVLRRLGRVLHLSLIHI